jgi:glycosyltransferase involved in cell wall biosynthesis
MKIGMVVHAYYLKDARVRRYAELLARIGHEVDVLCLREGDEPREETHHGVHIYRVNMPRLRGGKAGYFYEYLAAFLRFMGKLNRLYFSGRRYALVHVHNMPNFLVFCPAVQRALGCKVILDLHDLMPELIRSKYGLAEHHALTRLLLVEEKLSTRSASALITANHAFRDTLIGRGNSADKITVVMNAPERRFLAAFDEESLKARWRAADRGLHVMYTGTLAERYGVDIAIRAIARLKGQGRIPGLTFSIIPKIENEGEYVGKLARLIAELGVGETVSIRAPVPHDDMPATINSADLLLYAPLPDVHMDDALSLKIPEFMAVGRPVVASRLSVHLRYFGEEAMYLFEPGNIEECAAKVLDVYNDPERACEKVRRARAKIDAFSWPKQERIYLDLLARTLNAPIAVPETSP